MVTAETQAAVKFSREWQISIPVVCEDYYRTPVLDPVIRTTHSPKGGEIGRGQGGCQQPSEPSLFSRNSLETQNPMVVFASV